MEEKKYELTDETIDVDGHILHRIKAIRNFGNVKIGELGGYIEKESNLSHNGKCWVYDDAKVFNDANVVDNAKLYEYAMVFDNAYVSDNALIFGYASVYEFAEVCNNSEVYGHAKVYGDSSILNSSEVYDHAQVYGCSSIVDHSTVAGDSIICNANIRGYAKINQNGCIKLNDDYITFDRFGSRLGTTTMFRCSDGIIRVSCGCFSGTLKEFRNKVSRTHGFNKYAKEYEAIIKVAKVHFGIKRL